MAINECGILAIIARRHVRERAKKAQTRLSTAKPDGALALSLTPNHALHKGGTDD
jgi:hypothetical protein